MNLKKLFAYAATAALATNVMLPGVTLAQTSTFTSVEEASFRMLLGAGITSASNDTLEKAAGNQPLARQAAAVYAVRLADMIGVTDTIITGCDTFADENQFMNSVIEDLSKRSCELGIFGAKDGVARDMFYPGMDMNFGTAFTVAAKLLAGKMYGDPEDIANYGVTGTPTHFAQGFANWLEDQGIKTSYFNNAGLDTTMSRKAAFVLFANVLTFVEDGGLTGDTDVECIDEINMLINGEACPTDPVDPTDPSDPGAAKAGSLTVVLGSDTPANGSSIPNNGTVTFAQVEFTAGTDPIFVYSVDVKRSGLGDYTDISRIYFEKDGVRVSAKVALTSDQMATISFAPALQISAGQTETLDLVATLSGNAGSEHNFQLMGMNSSAATTNANFTTPTLRTTTYTVGSVSFESRGSNTTSRAGDAIDIELGQFRLVNTSTQTRDIRFKSISLRNEGTADLMDSLENVELYRDGTLVSKTYYISGKDVIFALDSNINASLLTDGASATFYVRGKIKYVDNIGGDTYNFKLRNIEDLNAIEDATKFRVTVDAAPVTLATYTVEAADVTFARSTGYDLNQTVVPGTNEVVIMKGTISSRESVQLEDPTFTIMANTGLSLIANKFTLRIGNTNSNWTPQISNGASATAEFNGTFIVNGTVNFELVMDVKSTSPEATLDVTQDLDITRFAVAEYLSNNNAVQSSVGSIAAAFINIDQTSLNMTRTDGLSNRTIVAGANDVTLMSATFSTTDSITTNITQINFTGTAPTNFNNNVSATLYVNGTAVRQATYSANALSFSSLNIAVSKNNPMVVTVKANFTQSLTGGTLALTLTNVNATDTNSQTVTPSPTTLTAATVTMAPSGSVSLTQNTNTPSSSLLAGGMDNVELARFNITAQNDSPRLTDLYLGNLSDATITSRLNNIKLYDLSNMSNAIGVATLRDGGIAFENMSNSNYTIPSGTTKTLVVMGSVNSVLYSGDVLAGSGVQLALSGSFTNPTTGQMGGIRLTSQNGSTITSVTNGGLTVGNTHRIVRGKPTVSLLPSSQWVIAESNSHVMEYTVTANQNRITVTDFDYSVSGLGAAVTIKVYKDSVSSANEVASVAGVNDGAGTITLTSSQEIQAGQSQRFIVEFVGYTPAGTGFALPRAFNVTGIDYLDMFQDGDLAITSAEAYVNVGNFPLSETYQP